MHRTIRQFSVLLLTVTLVLSGIAPLGMAAVPDSQFQPVSDSENVTIWERAILPFRPDTTDGATVIPNLNLFVNVPDANTGEVPANRDSLAVYSPDAPITLRFQSRIGANTTSFAHENVQLLVAKVNTSSAVDSEENLSGMPIEHGMRLLSGQNETATYEFLNGTEVDIDSDGKLDSNGEVTFTYGVGQQMNHGADRGAGKYVFFLVQNSQNGGFTVSEDGDLSVTGDARVLGVDGALVQQASATATPQNTEYDAGDSISFSVTANLSTDNPVNHAVIVYKQDGTANDGFIDQKAVIVMNETSAGNLSTENITLQRSIRSIYGVAQTDGDVSVFGRNLTDGRVSAGVGLSSLVEWISEKSGTTMPSHETIEPNESLPASATAVRTQTGTTTVTVETLANWSAGTYRYIYVASADNGTQMSTRTDLLTVRSSETDSDGSDSGSSDGGTSDGGAPSGGSSGGDAPSGGSSDGGAPSSGGSSGDAPTGDTGSSTPDEGESSVDQPKTVDEVEEEINSTTCRVHLRFTRSQTLSESTIQFSGDAAGFVRLQELSGLPSNVPSATQEGQSLVSQFHIYVPAHLRDQSAIVQFTVVESAVTTDPSTLTVLHYNDTATEWEELATTVVSRDNGTITLKATTPGFSLFAIRQGSARQQTPDPQTTPADPQATPDEPPSTPKDDSQQDDLQSTPVEDDNDDAGGVIPGFMSVLAFIVVVLLAITGVIVYRQRR